MSYQPYLWCPEQDSNLHASRHAHLKRARLPFRHLGATWAWIKKERKTRLAALSFLELVLLYRAENETRTRDPDLGKVVLYQLSYFRLTLCEEEETRTPTPRGTTTSK